jgi:hypothetical protein
MSYILGVYIFLTLQYGPHTAIFHDILRLSKDINSPNIHSYYNFVLGVSFLILGVVFLLIPEKIRNGIVITGVEVKGNILLNLKSYKFFFYGLAFLLLLISVMLQPGLKVTIENLKFFSGSSFFSYTEIRRVLFTDTLWGSFASLVRFTFVPLVFGYFVAIFCLSPKGIKRNLNLVFPFLFILIVAIQLNKFFYLYFIILFVFIFQSIRSRNVGYIDLIWVARKIPRFLFFTFLFFASVLLLYKVQYADAITDGKVSEQDIYETLIFRVFFASSDSLRLWIDFFTVQSEPMGGAVINSICHLFDKCFNPNTYIPNYYLDRELTSMQAGFLGTAFGVGGFYLVPVVAFIVSLIVIFNCYILTILQRFHPGLFIFVAPIMLINSFFLTTRELHTSSLSGGGVLISIILIFLLLFQSLFKRL